MLCNDSGSTRWNKCALGQYSTLIRRHGNIVYRIEKWKILQYILVRKRMHLEEQKSIDCRELVGIAISDL